jgi:hypothetical protein
VKRELLGVVTQFRGLAGLAKDIGHPAGELVLVRCSEEAAEGARAISSVNGRCLCRRQLTSSDRGRPLAEVAGRLTAEALLLVRRK